jgi:hypothetical protein
MIALVATARDGCLQPKHNQKQVISKNVSTVSSLVETQ